MISKLPRLLRNKYALIVLFFLIYITFFDAQDLISQIRIKWKLHLINTEMQELRGNNSKALDQIRDLTHNKESLEKFAREQYMMKRENEDIFVIIPKE